jgi:hypothetical protein
MIKFLGIYFACLASLVVTRQAVATTTASERLLQGLPPVVASEIGILLTTIGALDLELVRYETPITLRFTNYFTIVFWNCIAVYDDTFLAADTNLRPTVASNDASTFTSENRAICASQAAVTYSAFSMPGAVEGTIAANADIDIHLEAELDPDIALCDASDPKSTSFISCLQDAAAAGSYNPILMGQIVAFQAYLLSLEDGWNQLGTAKPNGLTCTYQCRNYTDPTGYAPINSPYDKSSFIGASSDRWQPLLGRFRDVALDPQLIYSCLFSNSCFVAFAEDNDKGFFYYQEHVTPHIGATAAFRYVPESDRASRTAPPPKYTPSRVKEMRSLLLRMAALDDVKKMQVEAFDNKVLIANAVFGAFVGKVLTDGYQDSVLGKEGLTLSYERLVHFVAGYIAAEYDSVIIAWKEKVAYDLIRPTSTIKRWKGGTKDITTWAQFNGVQSFKSTDFEAYKRVMPHSEYVSGTSCLFESVKEYVEGYLATINLDPTNFPVTIGPYAPGSSNVEPGLTPAAELTLTYSTIAAMADEGSESRLDGGMHFGAAVPGGKVLCSGIADYTIDGIFALLEQ